MLLDAIGDVKSSFGTQEFANELRYIQKHKIDAGLSDITKTVKKKLDL